MDPVRQYRERYRTLWTVLEKILRFNDTKKNSWTLGSMELWGQYLVGRRNWVLLLDRYERERRITKNGVLWGSSMDHSARPGKIPGIRKSSKNHLEKKLLNSESDLGQTFLATALIVQGAPVHFLSAFALPGLRQLATPYHHSPASVNPHTVPRRPNLNTWPKRYSIILNKINRLPPRKKSFDNAANSCIIVLL